MSRINPCVAQAIDEGSDAMESHNTPTVPSTPRTRHGWFGTARRRWLILGGLLVVGLLAAVIVAVLASRMMMMGSAPDSAQRVAGATSGEHITAVLEVTTVSTDGLLLGRVLERRSETLYQRTDHILQMRWNADTPVVMGQPHDLITGAVFQVSGQMDAARILNADRIVILTGYVTVQ
jgi:hypothetical protein